VLYEALGLGISVGPLVGGELGGISWRGPFFGVRVLMAFALVATVVFVDNSAPRGPRPDYRAAEGATAPGPATMSMTALCTSCRPKSAVSPGDPGLRRRSGPPGPFGPGTP
jgi:MFS transporter, ACDE family, multidrug resistance protein